MPLDLLVPDLLLPVEAPESLRAVRLPALERWLARGEMRRTPHPTLRAALAEAYGVPAPPAVAAITLAADAAPSEGAWLRADPVHLRIDPHAASGWLHDASALEVTRDEANALAAALNAQFAGDGFEFVAPVADRWYVRVPEGETPRTVALDEALGRNVFGLLPSGSGRINWPSAFTEVQMLLAAHPVNARREEQGLPAINSVWFWGEGARPARLAAPYALVYADEPFARGLAGLAGTRLAPRPAGFEAIDAVPEGETVLAVLDMLTAPLRAGRYEEWTAAALDLDERWFTRLSDAIERFEGVNIILPTGRETRMAHLGPGARWRWFRGRKPLSSRG